MRKLLIILFLILLAQFIIGVNISVAQPTGTGTITPIFDRKDENLYTIKAQMDSFFNSLKNVVPDSVLFAEGSDYNRYRKWLNFWEPRLYPHGDFTAYFIADSIYNAVYGIKSTNYKRSVPSWFELGPKKKPSGNISAAGVGPIEFLTFYEGNPDYMLCGSLQGGIFYSTNGGDNWKNTGTDTEWPRSGCSWAVFHPTDHQTWFASSGGNPQENSPGAIYSGGGIWRTKNEGTNWEQIADYTTFGYNSWIELNKLLIDPNNPNRLFVATKNGLYHSYDAMASQPVWTWVSSYRNKLFYDIEFKPGNSQIVYATVADWDQNAERYINWEIITSTDNGDTWSILSAQPINVTNVQYLTIEVSKANNNKLYALADFGGGKNSEVWYLDWSLGLVWTNVTPNSNEKVIVVHGNGNAFGINQNDENEIFTGHGINGGYAEYGGDARRIRIGQGFKDLKSTYHYGGHFHPDIEDIVSHPTDIKQIWIATHGGLYKSEDHGDSWIDKSKGIGVAQLDGFAASRTNPELILLGLYHDGSVLSQSPYFPNQVQDWKIVKDGDGNTTMIDPKDANYMWVSDQGVNWERTTNGLSGQNFNNNPPKSPGWKAISVINKNDPNYVYRTAKCSIYECIRRSNNKGSDKFPQEISDFSRFMNRFIIYGLYSSESNANYLAAYVIDTLSNPDVHYLFRTKKAINNDVNDLIKSWKILPLPRNNWIADVEFDHLNPDIIYISYYQSTNYANANYSNGATEMVYRIDYSNLGAISPGTCPSQYCTDLSTNMNLPVTYAAANNLELEYGSDGGIYLGTDFGVYYINNKLINNGDGWQKLGTGLPHVSVKGLEINYEINRIRVGTFGRGVWEHDLYCPDDENLTFTNIWHTSDDFFEAENNITSDAGILSPYNVTYRAGNEVKLQPGFFANRGSKFHAFIHPCNLPGNSFVRSIDEEKDILTSTIETEWKNDNTGFKIYPNPFNSKTNIEYTLEAETPVFITVFDIIGQQIAVLEQTETKEPGNYILEYDTEELAAGTYFVLFKTGEYQETKKIVKQ